MTPRSSAAVARQEEESCASVFELDREAFVRDSGIPNEPQFDGTSACVSGMEARAYSGFIPVAQKPLHYRFIKRLFDIIFSTCVIVVGFVPGLILSLLIVLDTKGSPIYSQVRCGINGKPFRIYKFRSMVADSDDVEKYFSPEQLELWKRERKVDNDPRITPLGRMLRSLSIDEFPSLSTCYSARSLCAY